MRSGAPGVPDAFLISEHEPFLDVDPDRKARVRRGRIGRVRDVDPEHGGAPAARTNHERQKDHPDGDDDLRSSQGTELTQGYDAYRASNR